MSKKNDLTGKTFGKLYVLESAGSDERGNQKWRCKCECGNIVVVVGYNLTGNAANSCGCYKRERWLNTVTKHGYYHSRLHRVWKTMIQRCENKNADAYKWYGARGIKVCDEWKRDFLAFREWAFANGYDETAKRGEYTIDRIDVNGDYCPENCRWITIADQQRNRRNSRKDGALATDD